VPLGERNGTRLAAVVLTEQAWLLDVDALVVPVGETGRLGPIGEVFAEALRSAIPDRPDLQTTVTNAVARLRQSALRPARPVVVHLPPPVPDGFVGTLIITTADPPPAVDTASGPTLETVGAAAAAAVRVAAERGLHRIAVPIPGPDEAGLAAALVAPVVFREVRTALRLLAENPLERIDLVVLEPSLATALSEQAAELRSPLPSNDLPGGRDLLDVTVDAHSLADMLLMRDLEPPLAIGVLGGWGSGKSFVMHLMQERMTEIRAQRVDPEQAWPAAPPAGDGDSAGVTEHVGHVYQICFNAWTYAHADLWAALMQTVFEELNRQLSLESALEKAGFDSLEGGAVWKALAPMPEEQRRTILENEEALEKLRARGADIAPDRLWSVLQEVRSEQRLQLVTLQRTADGVRAEIADERRALERTVDAELEREARAALWVPLRQQLEHFFGVDADAVNSWADRQRRSLGGGQTPPGSVDADRLAAVEHAGVPRTAVVRNVLRTQLRWVLAAVAAIAVAAIAAVTVDALGPRLAALAAPAVVAVESLAVLTRRGASAFAQARRAVDDLRSAIVAERQRLEDSREVRIEQHVRSDKPGLLEKTQRLAELEHAIERQRATVGLTADYLSASEFVRQRLEEGDYRDQLGLMRQVHVDLRDLTESLMVHDHDAKEDVKRKAFPRGPARVVLFIDDLDRCPPTRVVEVFEAIQLLLATRLFVVVVALDVRYVSRALEDVYKGVLERWGEPSGLDYIEKIVQIPYRTRRIDPSGMQRFLGGHLPIEEIVDEDDVLVDPVDSHGPEPTPAPVVQQAVTADEAGSVSRAMSFTEDEAAVMRACCEVVALSPRSVKRLVNVSKLVKLIWARGDRPPMPATTASAVSMLLALSGAHVEVMRGVFRHLEDRERARDPGRLIDLLEHYELPPEDAALKLLYDRWTTDVLALKALRPLEDASFELGSEPLSQIKDAVRVVSSCCFVGEVGEATPTVAPGRP
jgi:hypothetical protein